MDLQLYNKEIHQFCEIWNIAEFAFFGSVLRDDFKPGSDIDVLIEFKPEVRYSVIDLAIMQDQLAELFGREVDLVEKASLRNPFRRSTIMKTRRIVHVS